MASPILAYTPLLISIVVGLNMLWTEIVRGKNTRRQAGTVDQTTLEGKHIDDSIAWRKDILDENKTLRTDLSAANKLIAELTFTHATLIHSVSDKIDSGLNVIFLSAEAAAKATTEAVLKAAETSVKIEVATDILQKNNDILEKWLEVTRLKAT